jgi:hypothetical protein
MDPSESHFGLSCWHAMAPQICTHQPVAPFNAPPYFVAHHAAQQVAMKHDVQLCSVFVVLNRFVDAC